MANNLVTLAEVKTYNTISSITQDATINLLIPQVSQFVKTYCKNSFIDYIDDAKVETFNGGSSFVYLKEAPLISLQSVETSTDYGVTYTTLTSGTDYILDIENDRIQVVPGSVSETDNGITSFSKRINGYKVTYYAGYETVPADLKLAVLDLVSYYLKSDMSIKSSASVGRNSMAIEYITTSKLPSHISRVLDFYVQQLN